MKTADKKTKVVGHKREEWIYTDIVKDHFFHPRNIFATEKEAETYKKNADGTGQIGSPACGDIMEMYIKVDKKNNTIKECKWRTFGCASAIASTSILSEMVIGMKLSEAKKITPLDIVKALGGLPARKIHCSVLGDQALRAAIDDYERRRKERDKSTPIKI
ncbi:iron-sulfur cluster assembly scaffold protein [Candidatus Woesearchaeota archaeon]|nr:iron-sulfur cluster assembly scaffold protein [Candidatus Woesearchaeota archaeon]